jgi:hypothetical protein
VNGAGPRQEIAELTRAPGELSFEARVGGEIRTVWFRTETAVTPAADAALAACLMPAMRIGGTLSVAAPLSPRLLRTQRHYQAIQRAWSLDWDLDERPLESIEVLAPIAVREPRPPTGRVAAFFSGGVDSWSTVIENPDVTDLIFVRGVDIQASAAHQSGLADEVEGRLRAAAGALGKTFHTAETNVRELSDPLVRWEAYCACPLVAVALCFEDLFDRVLIASDNDHATQVPLGSGRMVDQLWSTEWLEVADDGGRFSREERLARVVREPLSRETLRVCWQNRGGAYNCGRCRKCLLTMISLEAIGERGSVSTFPAEMDIGLLADFRLNQPIQLILWEDLLDTTRAAGRTDLARAVEPVVASGKRALGLPPSYRVRSTPGPRSPDGGLS